MGSATPTRPGSSRPPFPDRRLPVVATVHVTVGIRWVCICGWSSDVLAWRGYERSLGAVPAEGWEHVMGCEKRQTIINVAGDWMQDVTVVWRHGSEIYEISYVGACRLNRR